MKNKLSLIIPSNIDHDTLEDYLVNVLFWTLGPDEIVIINTYKKKIKINLQLTKKLKKKKIKIRVLNRLNYYPGAARNTGVINSKYELLCFLDVNTVVYQPDWLEKNKNLLIKKNLDIILGQTQYLSNNNKEEVIVASTYGFKRLNTVPGTLIKKKIFKKIGFFNDKTRAGEDTEWLLRIKKLKYKFKNSLEPIYYKGLYEVSYIFIIKKWLRNYYSSSVYQHLFFQKIIYLSSFILSFLLIFFYIYFQKQNIFLNIMFFLSTLYVLFRAIYLPIIKKIRIYSLFSFNIFRILGFSLILDLTKVFSFLLSIFFKQNK